MHLLASYTVLLSCPVLYGSGALWLQMLPTPAKQQVLPTHGQRQHATSPNRLSRRGKAWARTPGGWDWGRVGRVERICWMDAPLIIKVWNCNNHGTTTYSTTVLYLLAWVARIVSSQLRNPSALSARLAQAICFVPAGNARLQGCLQDI